jgi:hypothetical protein
MTPLLTRPTPAGISPARPGSAKTVPLPMAALLLKRRSQSAVSLQRTPR